MPAPARWQKNNPTQAFLVALDISGFSRDPNPDQLSEHRDRLFHAVEETRLFAQARDSQDVKVHFLGDELRLALHTGVGAREVRNLVVDVFADLQRSNNEVLEQYRTDIKGVVLKGVLTWKSWHKCDYLHGSLPIKAQFLMGHLAPREIASDQYFMNALREEAVPTSGLPQREFSGETGYLLQVR